MTAIFCVEDDEATALELTATLARERYEVRRFATGGELMVAIADWTPDLLLLDRRLPDMDGLDIVHMLRTAGNAVPILVLSALSEISERVRGLRAGGDDYLAKPFEAVELLARIDALTRRPATIRESRFSVGPIVADLDRKEAWRDGRALELLPREFDILVYLARREGQIVTRFMLLRDVWGYRFEPRSNVVDVHIGKLRRKLDPPGTEPLIVSVRGQGFRLSIG
ncbi:response regulator transcription factor [Acuticoccus sp. MNP-M23]|uniref:response regulator transcription factor n=1 Tax=Acuticoccus sp. MNP-M23 TaxID=3072793 RepID=UPI002814FD5C|nr:response regulator transcription factor [Acuticoccus sp. MNP-M23]WMS41915.1 response regulator transcription factor [Acuticoccus sp. MNP-M23]